MEIAKLLKLADHLEALPSGVFDMEQWRYKGSECGTVACAVGHAADIFPELAMVEDRADKREGMYYRPEFTDPNTGERLRDYDAAAAFFGLSPVEADWLFNYESYYSHDVSPTIANVVARIRARVANWEDDEFLKELPF